MLKKENKRQETTLIDDSERRLRRNRNNLIQPLWNLALEILNEKSYQAMRLHYAEDLSIREIANIMGKTETGIKVLLFRSRQKLSTIAKIRDISL